MSLEAAIAASRASGRPPTLEELGGPAALRDAPSHLAGRDLPLLVPAVAQAAADGDDELASLLSGALAECDDPATFGAATGALPSAAGALADELVPVLLARAEVSGTPAEQHIAARATVAATGVALASDRSLPAARVALALSAVAPDAPDAVALAAVRAAGGLVTARPRDPAVREAADLALGRLVSHPEAGVDAAVEQAYALLADALATTTEGELRKGLSATTDAFEAVTGTDPHRLDAEITLCGLRAVLAFADGESVEALVARLDELCDERAMYGTGAGDAVSRRGGEAGWRLLAVALAEAQQPLQDAVWLDAAGALTLLVDAVRMSRAQAIGDSDLSVLVMPRLAAPFVEQAHQRALLQRYAEERVGDAERARAAVELLAAVDDAPKVEGSEPAAALLGALIDAGLTAQQAADVLELREALVRAASIERGTQWWRAFATMAEALRGHPDLRTRAGQLAVGVTRHVLDFVSDRFDLTRGSRPHLSYLTEANALEQSLADDLAAHLRYWHGKRVRVEVSDIGGGRVDVAIDLGDDRVVIECKRDRDPWAPGTLEGWATQADAYLATGSRIGLLVLLDLSDKSKGRPTDLAGSLRTFRLPRSPEDHVVVCAVVPGNQRSPSAIGAAARAAGRREARGAR